MAYRDEIARWAQSGAMALTGLPDGPPRAEPAAVAVAADVLAAALADATGRWGTRVEVDGPSLLGERAAMSGLGRNGSISVGGSAHFLEARDGRIVVNFARPEDVASLPALVSADIAPDDWASLRAGIGAMFCAEIRDQAVLLGMAVGQPGEYGAADGPSNQLCVGAARRVIQRPLVVDLSSLWGGPLAASLLSMAGARVIKVEGRGRPDGSRRGPRAFFDLLNADKEMLEIDFADRRSVALLHGLLGKADLVIEGSRPRAMAALGIGAQRLVGAGTSWLSITGHGRHGNAGDRVGFGDDAAVAAGLMIDDQVPMFVADAVADPLAGLAGALAGAEMLGSAQSLMVEVPLARAASWACGSSSSSATPTVVRDGDDWQVELGDERVLVAYASARAASKVAPPVGAHSTRLAEEFDPVDVSAHE